MNESNEKLEILNMIKEGKITPEQGVRLMEALDKADAPESGVSASRPAQGPRWINIEVRTKTGGEFKSLTPIRIPLSLVRLFLRFIPKESS
ncbi:MAG TPA: hypothetical protein PLQ76_03750, partial [bacterium]|nr:hypothetical protein [bacterium]